MTLKIAIAILFFALGVAAVGMFALKPYDEPFYTVDDLMDEVFPRDIYSIGNRDLEPNI